MRLFITAGEPSGDKLGAALIASLREIVGEIELAGIGGPHMIGQGLNSLFPMEELSVMGIAEILPKYYHLKRRIRETAKAAMGLSPDVLVTIDSPDFSFRVIDLLQRHRPPRTVHYVAPTVWAWRPKRAKRLSRRIDQVLALFPFEPPYFEAEGLRCDFVGHPIATEAPPGGNEIGALRSAVGRGNPLFVVLPGSRRSEVQRLGPIFGDTLRLIAGKHPGLRVLIPTVPHVEGLVRSLSSDWPGEPLVLSDPSARKAALWIADIALTKSGTITLELAAAGTPMVVAHDVSPVTRWIFRQMATIDTATLVNLVSDTRVVPEFLGHECRPDRIAPALLDLVEQPNSQIHALDLTMQRLGRGGEAPGSRAARAVLDGLSRG